MGGALAFAAAHLNPGLADGCVFLGPMLRIKPEAKPPPWQVPLLRLLGYFLPTLAVRPRQPPLPARARGAGARCAVPPRARSRPAHHLLPALRPRPAR